MRIAIALTMFLRLKNATVVYNQSFSQNNLQNVRERPKKKSLSFWTPLIFLKTKNKKIESIQISSNLVSHFLLLFIANFTLCDVYNRKTSDPKQFLGDPTSGHDL